MVQIVGLDGGSFHSARIGLNLIAPQFYPNPTQKIKGEIDGLG